MVCGGRGETRGKRDGERERRWGVRWNPERICNEFAVFVGGQEFRIAATFGTRCDSGWKGLREIFVDVPCAKKTLLHWVEGARKWRKWSARRVAGWGLMRGRGGGDRRLGVSAVRRSLGVLHVAFDERNVSWE